MGDLRTRLCRHQKDSDPQDNQRQALAIISEYIPLVSLSEEAQLEDLDVEEISMIDGARVKKSAIPEKH
jgi:hypothetical protein